MGYQYSVLRKDLLYLFRTFLWDDLSEMMKYLALEDELISDALQEVSSLRGPLMTNINARRFFVTIKPFLRDSPCSKN